MNELILFGSAFGSVFALGLQSLNVNGGHYRAAFITSLVIGVFSMSLYKLAPNMSSWTETAAFLIGGPIGIVTSMWAHKRIKAWMERRKKPFVSIQAVKTANDRLVGRYGGGRYGPR